MVLRMCCVLMCDASCNNHATLPVAHRARAVRLESTSEAWRPVMEAVRCPETQLFSAFCIVHLHQS